MAGHRGALVFFSADLLVSRRNRSAECDAAPQPRGVEAHTDPLGALSRKSPTIDFATTF
jgi:hypothetical protein